MRLAVASVIIVAATALAVRHESRRGGCMAEINKKTDLNIYLFKEGVKEADAISSPHVTHQNLQFGGKPVGTLYVKSNKSSKPKWTRFFDDVLPTTNVFGRNSSTGAVLVIGASSRTFALAFGQGRHLLQTENSESNFGLRVTLNCVDENSLRSLDKASFEERPTQSREQTGKAAGLPSFVVDVERDLLRALTGKPADPYYGERISGMDSLKLALDIHIAELPKLLQRLLKDYEAETYKQKGFAFVDHVREVRDAELIKELDDQLIDSINAGNTEKIWLTIPELVDWDRAVGFKYSAAGSVPRHYDVKLSDFIETLKGADLQKVALLSRRIYCVDSDDVSVFDKPAYYYIYAERVKDDLTYVLNNGKWYLIDKDFVAEVNAFYKDIPRYQAELPAFDENDETEGDYNSRVAKANPAEFALLDKNNVLLPGALAPVEPCDLYRKPRQFIHVKRYGGSSLLSHLFNQGTVSAELFRGDVRFRQAVNGKLPDTHKLDDCEKSPTDNEYTIVYAIISEYEEELTVPFFSRITLRHAVNRLRSWGYAVEIAKVPVTATKKVMQVVPTKTKKKPKAAV
jgi:uncharacterized protein (TIGR04141 family)